jgi:hypothetical protein
MASALVDAAHQRSLDPTHARAKPDDITAVVARIRT